MFCFIHAFRENKDEKETVFRDTVFKLRRLDAAHALHEEMDCICFENDSMGIYFIQDPDGYWLEVLPEKDR